MLSTKLRLPEKAQPADSLYMPQPQLGDDGLYRLEVALSARLNQTHYRACRSGLLQKPRSHTSDTDARECITHMCKGGMATA